MTHHLTEYNGRKLKLWGNVHCVGTNPQLTEWPFEIYGRRSVASRLVSSCDFSRGFEVRHAALPKASGSRLRGSQRWQGSAGRKGTSQRRLSHRGVTQLTSRPHLYLFASWCFVFFSDDQALKWLITTLLFTVFTCCFDRPQWGGVISGSVCLWLSRESCLRSIRGWRRINKGHKK